MNTPEENSVYHEGVVDVGILVPACFENPLKEHSIDLIAAILSREKTAVVPVSSIIGAYHIATRYLKVSKVAVKRVLEGILRSGSPSLHPQITVSMALDALDYALAYDVESWDGYLISLARSLGSTVVYTLDEELMRVKEITAVNPFPSDKVKQYHEFLGAKLQR